MGTWGNSSAVAAIISARTSSRTAGAASAGASTINSSWTVEMMPAPGGSLAAMRMIDYLMPSAEPPWTGVLTSRENRSHD